MPGPRLILASGSPRRRQLLEQAGYDFTVIVPPHDVECGICSERGPAGLVADLAYRKAAAVRRVWMGQISTETDPTAEKAPVLVAADTVAECAGSVLGKPRDEAHARAILRQLCGRTHRVLTGLCVWPLSYPGSLATDEDEKMPIIRVATTQLVMDNLSNEAVEDYLATGGWQGKAGAFGYQDQLGWVHVESGSETNVVGLPMELLAQMLAEVKKG